MNGVGRGKRTPASESLQMPKAELLFKERRELADNALIESVIWAVPAPVPPSPHSLKYSLVYIVDGKRIVGNERGKGDHRHYGARQEPYDFTSPERLMADFLADVRAAGGDV